MKWWYENRWRISCLVLLMLCAGCCTGCWDKKELNQLALAQVIAIDYQDGQYQVTLQLILPSAEQETVTGDNLWSMSGTGPSVGAALQQIALAAPRELYLDHLALVLLGEGVLEQSLEQGIDYLLKENVLRRRTYLLAVQGNAGTLLSQSAELAKMDIFYMDNLLQDQSRRVQGGNTTINDYYLASYNGVQEALVVPRIVLEPEVSLRLDGAALVQAGQLIAWVDRDWLEGYYWTSGGKEIITLQQAVSESEDKGQIIVELQKEPCKWELASERPLSVTMHLRGKIKIVSGFDSWKDRADAETASEQIVRQVELHALEQIDGMLQVVQPLGADTVGLGRWLYGWHPQLVQENRWPKQFATLPIQYQVQLEIAV